MAATLNIFLAILLLSITNGAYGESGGVSYIHVSQARTGRSVEGQPEYEVTVSNKYFCAQSNVLVNCFGLNSVKPVDPRVIKPVDAKRCSINEGKPIPALSQVKFTYAWKTPQDFPVVSALEFC
ncbi:protein TAPETUM DETERMINANT 1-like [Elaeis guineensis]|uniref:Protein TAPETUM DETERMINANT 1-like n=1 Tax=Elaeis guineensis var. tenera TaxID=51953 RepID=A0A6I9RPA5_ELAGV|nr:protein TAPETUM DETERMINANT 1-like [Elaeis guineensis]